MKTKKSIQSNAIRRLLLVVPVTCSKALAACSDLAGMERTHPIDYQNAVMGGLQTDHNVIVGPATYNSETQGFELPWLFGPEYNAQ
jgi:hypothetical protein